MDLALELGMPVGELARRLPQREFKEWGKYASTKFLPTRRVEHYLAQIAMLIATTMGGAKDVTISDFLLDQEPDDDTAPSQEEVMQAFGVKPKRKK